MKITNSPRISAKQHILPGRCGHRPLRPFIEQTLSEFHTSNIQRVRTKRLAQPIVRLENPIGRPPEGRSDYGNETTKRTTERKAFQARSAISRPKEPLNKSPTADDGSFPPILRFEKREIHTVFPRFSNLVLTKNLSPSTAADLIRTSLTVHSTYYTTG